MSEFTDVTLVREANVYFGGKVVSRTVQFPDGTKKTLGFMQAGDYTFDTGAAEIMELLGGSWDILLPGEAEFTSYPVGSSFKIPANAKFSLKVGPEGADYCCSYLG